MSIVWIVVRSFVVVISYNTLYGNKLDRIVCVAYKVVCVNINNLSITVVYHV